MTGKLLPPASGALKLPPRYVCAGCGSVVTMPGEGPVPACEYCGGLYWVRMRNDKQP